MSAAEVVAVLGVLVGLFLAWHYEREAERVQAEHAADLAAWVQAWRVERARNREADEL